MKNVGSLLAFRVISTYVHIETYDFTDEGWQDLLDTFK